MSTPYIRAKKREELKARIVVGAFLTILAMVFAFVAYRAGIELRAFQ